MTESQYQPGHPWFCLQGGTPPTPGQIEADAAGSPYGSYRVNDIAKADKLPEPRRSAELRELLAWAELELAQDRERYAHYVAKLAIRRRDSEDPAGADTSIWDELCTALSLKYCHLFNDFAHQRSLRHLVDRQPSLF